MSQPAVIFLPIRPESINLGKGKLLLYASHQVSSIYIQWFLRSRTHKSALELRFMCTKCQRIRFLLSVVISTKVYWAHRKKIHVITRIFSLITLIFRVIMRMFRVITRIFRVITRMFRVITRMFRVITRIFRVITLIFRVITRFFSPWAH